MKLQITQQHIDKAFEECQKRGAWITKKCPIAQALKEVTTGDISVQNSKITIGNNYYKHNGQSFMDNFDRLIQNKTHIIVQTIEPTEITIIGL